MQTIRHGNMSKLASEKIKLESGREVEIFPLELMDRAQISDLAVEKRNRKIPLSMEMCVLAILKGTKLTAQAINEWSSGDIYECGARIYRKANLEELEKKKL